MSSRADEIKQAAKDVISDTSKLQVYIDDLGSSSRITRQNSAAVIAEVSRIDATLVSPYGNELVDVLDLPEAQTRWEALDALTEICILDSCICEKALDGAETALFDEDSGPLHLSAMRFLCRLGSTTESRSEKVWGLIDEAIQCYHGDVEFNEMLIALIDFSSGNLAPSVKKEFSKRMKFDSTKAKGILKKRAQQIEENLSQKK